MLSWKQDKLLIQAAQGEFLHTLNPNTPFRLEADLIHPPQRKVRYLFLFFRGGKERGKNHGHISLSPKECHVTSSIWDRISPSPFPSLSPMKK